MVAWTRRRIRGHAEPDPRRRRTFIGRVSEWMPTGALIQAFGQTGILETGMLGHTRFRSYARRKSPQGDIKSYWGQGQRCGPSGTCRQGRDGCGFRRTGGRGMRGCGSAVRSASGGQGVSRSSGPVVYPVQQRGSMPYVRCCLWRHLVRANHRLTPGASLERAFFTPAMVRTIYSANVRGRGSLYGLSAAVPGPCRVGLACVPYP